MYGSEEHYCGLSIISSDSRLYQKLDCGFIPSRWLTTIDTLPEDAVANQVEVPNQTWEDVALDEQESDGEHNDGPNEEDIVTDDEG